MGLLRHFSLLGVCLLGAAPAGAASINQSKHNLSISGPGSLTASKSVANGRPEVCVFCHTPHTALRKAALWNRYDSTATYLPYKSTTIKATIGQPTGASKLCLSCHDGTVALGMVGSRRSQLQMKSASAKLPSGRANLGTDLSDDHPISFKYDSALVAADGQLRPPPTAGRMHLDGNNELQCTSCHDPHNSENPKFLVMNNTASALCVTCHNLRNWGQSSHSLSSKTWNGGAPNPWPHTTEKSVAANGCENCHNPHGAGGKQRLLNYAAEEQNCYACHNGNAAAKNIQAEFSKPSVHPVINTTGIHDPMETTLVSAGAGRHFARVDNDHDQMRHECHASLNVTNSIAGSHPVGIRIAIDATHKNPTALPLENTTTNLGCLTCHKIHHSPANDATLVRLTNSVAVCVDCHLQSDTLTPAAHLAATNSATLWPGGRFGSLMPPRTELADRGACLNCHPTHGWPNAANPTNHYPKLLADFEENLCLTCHGTNGPAVKQVQADFAKTRHHPVLNSQQTAERKVECTDCHNSHVARSGGLVYTSTATATRNQVTGPLRGVSGVAVNYSSLTNFQTMTTNRYTLISALAGAANEYQICFKCHSSYAWGTSTPPNGLSPNGSATTPVGTDLAQEFSPNNRSGHPIVTGLDNYPNSTAVGGKKGLLAAAMKAPWNVNLGQQTMTCTDCHNTDAATPAAQGPHGSAAQFMLRGTNANNWPNITLANRGTSWCMNCHNDSGGRGHTESDHRGAQCYVCHIVIPHGGKMSRLIADRDGTMPVRYAYNNNLTNVGMQQFTKAAVASYSENSSCRTACGHHSNGTGTENW